MQYPFTMFVIDSYVAGLEFIYGALLDMIDRPNCFEQLEGAFLLLSKGPVTCPVESIGLNSQVYIPKRRTLIQVLPPIKFFCYLLMHICILPENCN